MELDVLFPNDTILRNGVQVKQKKLDYNYIDYYKGSSTLIVVFDGYGKTSETKTREPWGFKYLYENNLSILGIKHIRNDWYRNSDLISFFKSDMFSEFIHAFEDVIFYGGSMGGYAALTFSKIRHNSTIIALCPQSTLNRSKVPWEKRYPESLSHNWENDFHDAYASTKVAKKVYIVYDPFFKPDRLHVSRLEQKNIIHLKIPFVEHEIGGALKAMDLLKKIINIICINKEDIQESEFSVWAKKRRKLVQYYLSLAKKSKKPQCQKKILAKINTFQNLSIHETIEYITILEGQGEIQKAIDIIDETIKIHPNIGSLYGHKSQLLGKIKEYNESLKMAKKAVILDPENINQKVQLSHSLKKMGKIKEALSILDEAIQLNPHAGGLYGLSSEFFNELADYQNALNMAKKYILLSPNSVNPQIIISRVYENLGQTELALSFIKKAITLNPQNNSLNQKKDDLELKMNKKDTPSSKNIISIFIQQFIEKKTLHKFHLYELQNYISIQKSISLNSIIYLNTESLKNLKQKLLNLTIKRLTSENGMFTINIVFLAETGQYKLNYWDETSQIIINKNVKGTYEINTAKNSSIYIDEGTTSNGVTMMCIDSNIQIGKDCMFSDNILLQATDQHGIVDIKKKQIINNYRRHIHIKEHVWIARNATIMPDVIIGNGSVIATGAIVTKDIPENTIAAGVPAIVVKQDMTWSRHTNNFDNYSLQAIQGYTLND